jgi:23S rRNA pseudouridine1911/1915/1917 synthase
MPNANMRQRKVDTGSSRLRTEGQRGQWNFHATLYLGNNGIIFVLMDKKRYRIVYEDEQIIVVDKPSGMLVIPTPKKETNTLTDLLNRELDERGIEENAHPCHRLDRETSGLIIYAKGKSMQHIMMEEFKKRAVKKTYIAFVNGRTEKDFDIIKKRIYNRNKNRFDEAITKYKTIERREDFTIVEAEPVTGRTNQIRIHFKEIDHPLVGESVFAFRKDFKLKFKRAALHASYIRFAHPVTKKTLDFSAPMPDDMKTLLNK